MKTIEEIKAEVKELLETQGYELSFPVVVNRRFSSTLGRCRYVNKGGKLVIDKMEFAQELIDKGSDEEIQDVVRHEVCHILAFLSTGETHGHDEVFKEWAVRLGTPPKSTTSVHYETTKKPFKYFGYCEKCGKLVLNRRTKSSLVRDIDRYRSACCGSKIKIETKERG